MFYGHLILIVSILAGFTEQARISQLNAYCSGPENKGHEPYEVKCGKNAQCNTYLNVCQCPVGSVPHSNEVDCVLSGACKNFTECGQFGKYARCSGKSLCACPEGMGVRMSHKNLSMCATNIEFKCETDYECGQNAYCGNLSCRCKQNTVQDLANRANCIPRPVPTTLPPPVHLAAIVLDVGDRCGEYSNTKCGQNAICYRGTNEAATCQCIFGYKLSNWTNKECKVIECSGDGVCPIGSRCVSRMCQCKPDYGLNVRTQTCQANFSHTLTCAYAYFVIAMIIAFLL